MDMKQEFQGRIHKFKIDKFRQLLIFICDGAKQIFPNKQTKILRKDTERISEAVVGRYSVKKVSLKILPPVQLHIIKIDVK